MKRAHALIAEKSPPLTGHVRIPGDKSISHRAVMLGGIAIGETIISGLLEGEDVLATAGAMRALGAKVYKTDDGLWHCFGTGTGGFREPDTVLDMGNSGTSTRLLMGLVAGNPIGCVFTGDSSLIKRPMRRIITPLEAMGARIMARSGGYLPLALRGAEDPVALTWTSPVPSAQVKSAILLAGLGAMGTTTVIEPTPTRDHTENMLQAFGLTVERADTSGGLAVSLTGQSDLKGCAVDVPADPSSAAFPAVAALLIGDSDIVLPRVCLNPRRAGLYETLQEMGAQISFLHARDCAGERVADIRVQGTGALRGVDVPPARVPEMIDEIPVLAIAAACAEGTTRLSGLAELRVKESDRLQVVGEGLVSCGVEATWGEDWMTIVGTGKPPKGGVTIDSHMDHRIAMSFLVLGLVTDSPVRIDDARPIATSFPDFVQRMQSAGARIAPETDRPHTGSAPPWEFA